MLEEAYRAGCERNAGRPELAQPLWNWLKAEQRLTAAHLPNGGETRQQKPLEEEAHRAYKAYYAAKYGPGWAGV